MVSYYFYINLIIRVYYIHVHILYIVHSSLGYRLAEFGAAGGSEDSDSEFEPGRGRRAKGRRQRGTATSDFIRMTSRKRGVVSYKESSRSELSGEDREGGGERWDGEEGEGGVVLEDNRDAIEKIIRKQTRGKEVAKLWETLYNEALVPFLS